MGTSAEVYNYQKIMEWVFRRVQNSSMQQENKQLILNFARYLLSNGLSKGRIIKYTIELTKLAELLRKPFSNATKQDVVDLAANIEARSDYTLATKHDYRLSIKKIFKFVKGTEAYPEEVSWIKIGSSKSKRLLPEELITEEDVKKLADAARTPRDKALVLVLYESGCRIGELLSLKLRNLQFDEYGAQLIVNGKTGMRRVRIIASVPALATWLESHPLKENPSSPLWVTIGTRTRDTLIGHRAAIVLLKKMARRAGINKRVYPHLFRHSRATHLASHLTEAQMKQHFGWVQGSDMASIYVHLSGRDVDAALLKLNGVKVEDRDHESQFKAIVCVRCTSNNSPASKFCSRCGLALELKKAMEIDETREKIDKLLDRLTEDPEKLQRLLELVA